jgi:GTP-binding protein
MIGDTLCHPSQDTALPPIFLEEPTLSIEISVNNGPLAGREGKHVTMNKLRARLLQEKKANISLKIEEVSGKEDAMKVAGRGELHLAVLIEAMRREGYEMNFSKPQVITKEEDGKKLEPYEVAHIEVPQEYSGAVIEELSRRSGEMRALTTNEHEITSIEFLIPTRSLMGYRSELLTVTRGLGIMTALFDHFGPHKGPLPGRQRGVLVSMSNGKATPYALFNLQDRGSLFASPGQDIYEGMIVGENKRDNDLVVNAVREKQLTNVRASGTDENVILTPARVFTLEDAIDYIEDDELVEVTPQSIRLRKRHLKESDRKRKKS